MNHNRSAPDLSTELASVISQECPRSDRNRLRSGVSAYWVTARQDSSVLNYK
jgi:hypothetical protein